TFGPVLAFGIGGTYTEILQDFSVAVGAIDEGKAMELIQELRMGRVLDGHRGGPKVDRVRIAKAMSAFSSVLEENPSIDEIEINPLIATEERLVAVDVRTVVA
ncbi:MAG TPA: acetate--CoA ligase family protein, partial [Nitrososphaerales archaeon]|nr:acetate--CoA ligase family protein [Nitrososphaerales archaeon]